LRTTVDGRPRDRLTSHKYKRDEVFAALRKAFKEKSREEWIERLAAADVPVYPVLTIAEVFKGPHIPQRGMLQTLEHPTEGTTPQIGIPAKL
jgi:crotonobetainyl-CoA:carnitine CoA-transferase CaiB-like acyl-CoA transferase